MSRFAFRIGCYKNGVVGKLTLRAAAQQHGSENLHSTVIVLTLHSFFSLIPMRWGYRKQNLLLMRWDIMTSHLELTDIFIVFLKAIYGGRMELD